MNVNTSQIKSSGTIIQETENLNFPCDTKKVELPPEIGVYIVDLANNHRTAEVSHLFYKYSQKTLEWLENAFDAGRFRELKKPQVVYKEFPLSLLNKIQGKMQELSDSVPIDFESILNEPFISPFSQEVEFEEEKNDPLSKEIAILNDSYFYILEQSLEQIDKWAPLVLDQEKFYQELQGAMISLASLENMSKSHIKRKPHLLSLLSQLIEKILSAAPVFSQDEAQNPQHNQLLTQCLQAVWQMQRPDLVRLLHAKCSFHPVRGDNRKVCLDLPQQSVEKLSDMVAHYAAKEFEDKTSIDTTLEVMKCFLYSHAHLLVDKAKRFHEQNRNVHPKLSDVALMEWLTHPNHIQQYGFSHPSEEDLFSVAAGHGLTENVSLLLKEYAFTSHQILNALNRAATIGHLKTVQVLLSLLSPDLKPRFLSSDCHEAMLRKQAGVGAHLLDNQRLQMPLIFLCQFDGQSPVVQKLLAHPQVKAGLVIDDLFQDAIDHHAFDVVELLAKEVSDPFSFLKYLVDEGEVTLTRLLLNNCSVDVTQDNDSLLELACTRNHRAMVELLREEYQKQDPLRDFDGLLTGMQKVPTFSYHTLEEKLNSLESACEWGEAQVVQDLLKDEEVLAKLDLKTMLLLAARYGHHEVVHVLLNSIEALLAKEEVTEEEEQYIERIYDAVVKVFQFACLNGNEPLAEVVVHQFLDKYEFVYTVEDLASDRLLGIAYRLHFIDIIKILSSSTSIDIEEEPLKDIVISALEAGRHDVIRVLLAKEDYQKKTFTHFGYPSYEEMLEKDERFAFLRHGTKRSAEFAADDKNAKLPKI